jgi:uncharacterized protein (DUF2147 family)
MLTWGLSHVPAHAAGIHEAFGGDWYSPAEDDEDVAAIIRLTHVNHIWRGQIVRIIPAKNSKHHNLSLCNVCPEPQHGHTLQGLDVIWGMKENGDYLNGGQILDPSNGHVYSCELHLLDKGKQLQVKAFVGLPMFGETQIWQRAD